METQSACDVSLRFAIANKRLIGFFYNSKWRIAEPHDYGIKNGSAKVLVYQLRGESSSFVHGWKLLNFSKTKLLKFLKAPFPGRRRKRGQPQVAWTELFLGAG